MKIAMLEVYVEKALREDKEARKDDFILYLDVIENFVDTGMSLKSALKHHDTLGLPPFESVSRCRRKVQERDNSLKDTATATMREAQRKEFKDYALADKQWY